ncbi:MAG: DUF4190 domain-containing protein [Labilithrix sp.]|nr:DUF4190 domain-containing protein [Labilithrix sp.]
MGPFHPYVRPPHAPPPRPPTARTDDKAVVALVLGLLSIGCVGPVAGLPAIILGSRARRDIDRSNGALTGRAIAAAGVVSGLFGTGLGVVLALWAIGAVFDPDMTDEPLPAAGPALEAPADPPPTFTARPAPTTSGAHTYGSLEVIDLDDSRGLHAQLAEIVQRSRGRTVVLQTNARGSAACAAVAAALPDERMRGALADVTLVRVDVDEYESELQEMRVVTTAAPWFYKLDAKGQPTDAMSGDAWGADLPENMAPVLGKFVHRAAPRRRGVR